MKKILSFLILFILLATPSWATTYYACIAGNINVENAWEDAVGCDGTTFTIGTGGFPASGSILEANGAAMTVNVDPGPNGKVHLKNTAGGSFAAVTSVTPITINADVTAGTADCLTISGSANANPSLTVIGTFTGSAATTNADALYTTHTVGTLVLGSVGTSAVCQGGAAGGTNGCKAYGAGPITAYVNATGGAGASAHGLGVVSGVVTMTGTCTGGGTSAIAYGCGNSAAGTLSLTGNCVANVASGCGTDAATAGGITVVGSIVASASNVGAVGKIKWNPVAPDDGVGSYVSFDGGGTAIFVGRVSNEAAAGIAAKVSAGEYFIYPTNGTPTVGTASGGGGGAWGY